MKSPVLIVPDVSALDPDLLEVDTTPRGADPEEPLAFGADDEEEDEGGIDAAAFAEEPWSVVDLEAAEPEVDESQPLSFGGVEIEDDSTFERWLQSALKATVAPKLVVDGRLGPATERAILAFQQRAQALAGRRLAADGVLGKQTIAALEVATDSEAPSREAKPAAEATGATKAWATSSFPPLKVSEVAGKDGATEYVISDGEQEVRFSYWTPGYRDYKPERSTTPPGIPPNPQIGCNPTKSGVLEGGGVFTGEAERRRGRSRQAKTRQCVTKSGEGGSYQNILKPHS